MTRKVILLSLCMFWPVHSGRSYVIYKLAAKRLFLLTKFGKVVNNSFDLLTIFVSSCKRASFEKRRIILDPFVTDY